jgi:hypothetical protein
MESISTWGSSLEVRIDPRVMLWSVDAHDGGDVRADRRVRVAALQATALRHHLARTERAVGRRSSHAPGRSENRLAGRRCCPAAGASRFRKHVQWSRGGRWHPDRLSVTGHREVQVPQLVLRPALSMIVE